MRRSGIAVGLAAIVALGAGVGIGIAVGGGAPDGRAPITEATLRHAENLVGLEFTDEERAQLLEEQLFFRDVHRLRAAYDSVRTVDLDQTVRPALYFRPEAPGPRVRDQSPEPRWSPAHRVERPEDLESLAFAPIGVLAELIRTGRVTSVELTEMYLDRLRRHDPELHAVVTLTEDLALEQARRADGEIAAGRYRGPLHGIPYGAKDLLAVAGHPTTWGAEPYRDQTLGETATVVQRLEEAGAVLVAKLSLGALAWGDVWFGGQTRNPWNTEEGSSGSSAGSAASVSAGLVPFALGTETWGSIVSPSTRTGVTGLRPSFGRVPRTGGMFVSWSMDKIGPICRVVEDCAIVFDAIRGPDGQDRSVSRAAPFGYRPRARLDTLEIGYLDGAFRGEGAADANGRDVLEILGDLGADLRPIGLPDRPIGPLSYILGAEAGAAFDELTRSDRDDLLTRQIADAWPNVYRTARFIPAVEYLQANRVRTLLGREMQETMRDLDVYVAPSGHDPNGLLTNLTGHPAVVVPTGFDEEGSPTSVVFVAGVDDEAAALAVAKAFQDATDYHTRQPPGFGVGEGRGAGD